MFNAIAAKWQNTTANPNYNPSLPGDVPLPVDPNAQVDPYSGQTTNFFDVSGFDPAWLKSIGFAGQAQAGNADSGMYASPEFQKFVQDQGIKFQKVLDPESGTWHLRAMGPNGQQIGQDKTWQNESDNAFGLAALAAGGLAGGAAAGAFGAGAGGGAAEGLAGQEALQSGIGAAGGFGQGAAAGATADVAYQPYTGEGSQGYQVAGDNPVAPNAGYQDPYANMETTSTPWGSNLDGTQSTFGQAGSALSGAGDWMKANPGLVNVGGSLVNGLIGAYSGNKALNAQTDATNAANALWKPYRDLGVGVLPNINKLLQDPNSITADPGYQFGLNQGVTARDRSAASKGMLFSGAQGKAQTRFGQDYAGTKLDQSLNRLMGVAQLGATGTAPMAANTVGLGDAGAANSLYQGNTWMGGVNNALANWNASSYGGNQGYPPYNGRKFPG